MKNKKIIYILLTMIMMLSMLSGCGKKEAKVTTTESNTTEAKEAANEETSESSPFKVEINSTDGWAIEDKHGAQYDGIFYNNSGADIDNWEISFEVPADSKVDSSWNGEFTIENNVLTIKPVDYNTNVADGTNISIGMIFITPDDTYTPKAITIKVDGVEYKSGDKEKATTTESTTEAEKETNKEAAKEDSSKTPVANHGKLSLDGVNIVDESGNVVQLKGVSTHGINWFPEYVNEEAFKTLRDDWKVNTIRLAMYTDDYNGYCSGGNQEELKKLLNDGVTYATKLGMYAIIDWHILNDSTPVKNQKAAENFFEEMSKKYADSNNVIYEICNEPNGGTSWSEIKGYAESVIAIIRANDPDAIIIVGTPNWSQDVDVASKDPIDDKNVMYALHFYATTHTDGIRSKAKTAIDNGAPIFVSECSICDASGNGSIDYNQADKWMEFINTNNLSMACWNLSNKDESSSLIAASCKATSGWSDSDYSDTGKWFKEQYSK